MIDMKLKPDNAGTMLGGEVNEGPQYPYGLTVTLDNESLKKLAIGESTLPQVGQQMMLHAMVEVVGVTKDANQIQDGRRVELQITAMELLSPDAMNQPAEKDPAQSLYG